MRLLPLFSFVALALCAIVGIDLGHQYTKAIMVAPGIPFDVIFTDEGKRKDVSALYIKPIVEDTRLADTERVYGSQIGSLCTRYPASCASNLKPLLGKTAEDDAVKHYVQHHPGAEALPNIHRNNSVLLRLGSAADAYLFSVEELMGMYLNNLKQRVLRALEAHPQARSVAEDVAVSVPPYADQMTRLAYLDALQLGEFSSVLGLVDDGVAAALAYVNGRKFSSDEYNDKKSYHVIYDVGAGSTSATLFSFTPHKNRSVSVDIESFGFDPYFCGELLTHNVYDVLYSKFLTQFGLDDSFNLAPKLKARLLEAAEKAKTVLSANSDYIVSLESFYDDRDFRATITRQEFEEYSFDSAERAIQPILDAVNSACCSEMSISAIDSVILNGGSTRTPFIQRHEEKIAKAVNTDEACALGTTIRAYQLKMMSSANDIVLNDRIFSNFQYSLNDSDELGLVFASGSMAGNKTQVELSGLSDTLSVSLYENGNLVGTYELTDLVKRAEDIKCEDVNVVGTFEVDNNKIFSLDEVTLRCPKDPKKSSKSASFLLETPVAEELKETLVYDQKSFNFTKPKPRTQVRVPVARTYFAKLRSLSMGEKKDILAELHHLRDKDEEKIALQEKKNELESLCYGLRAFVEESYDELKAEIGDEELESAKDMVTETIDWLEYDAHGATFEEIESKRGAIAKNKDSLSRVQKTASADLSFLALRKMYDEGKGVSAQVEEYLKEYRKQLTEMKDKYVAGGFDYEAEDEKIMTKIYGSKKKRGNTALENLRKFELLSKEELFETSEAVTSLVHEQRLEQAQKEIRQKKKEAAEKEAAEKTADDAAKEAPEFQDVSDSTSSEAPDAEPESIPQPEVDHDEL
ncbi:actin-like ATPase domain-containing protein [Metschnikowia bicuspidata]|uniref:Actin-like ATPase domain-containing protein n=1 Tax=Metschnikowia bicuspidata TaxID=27322 RepID=A0A4P9ZCS8_9ASCO|nr:actin-like ATPase domain-containing protein [Metschnikowia bicuspidata]